MKIRRLGSRGPDVSAIGFGCMSLGIADVYTSSIHNDEDAIKVVHRSLELGMNFLDTADVYGDSEEKVGKAIRGKRDRVFLATKFGFVRGGGSAGRPVNGTPEYIREACESSLKRLGVDYIDLYQMHRVDDQTPIEESVGAMAELVKAGKVKYIGLSEPSMETVRRAHKVHPLTSIQNEYSLFTRDPESGMLDTIRELGIGLIAYSPLGRGFLAGRFASTDELSEKDWRRGHPRWQGENFERNMTVAERVKEVAAKKGCTPAQLALAWVLHRGDDIVPIPGTSSIKRLEENAAAADINLSADDLKHIEAAAPQGAQGDRYNANMIKLINR
jgi:aryl-alcohol dehydrogenase-like predicted oxidoreductase